MFLSLPRGEVGGNPSFVWLDFCGMWQADVEGWMPMVPRVRLGGRWSVGSTFPFSFGRGESSVTLVDCYRRLYFLVLPAVDGTGCTADASKNWALTVQCQHPSIEREQQSYPALSTARPWKSC